MAFAFQTGPISVPIPKVNRRSSVIRENGNFYLFPVTIQYLKKERLAWISVKDIKKEREKEKVFFFISNT